MPAKPHGAGAAARRLRRPLAGAHALALAWLVWLPLAHAQGTFTPREETPEELPAGPGRDEIFYACTACHNFKLVAQQGMTRTQWDETLDWMTQKHNMPPLEGSDRELVLDYLEANYPPRAPAGRGGWQNPFMKQ